MILKETFKKINLSLIKPNKDKPIKKVVLITGASSGIGRASATFLSEAGFIVYAGSRTPEKFETVHPNLHPIKLDLTSFEDIKEQVDRIYQAHNRLDIVINNAGYGLVSTVEDATEEQMKDQFDVNLFGTFRVCKAVIPLMRKQKSGVIINVSSFLGKVALPLLSFYSASKFAMEGMTDALRYELKGFNIRVHSVMPGFFKTNFTGEDLVTNQDTFDENSVYADLVSTFPPQIIDEINNGSDPIEVAEVILKIINDANFPARVIAGEKAQKFIPMRTELSDEDFESRVIEHYKLS